MRRSGSPGPGTGQRDDQTANTLLTAERPASAEIDPKQKSGLPARPMRARDLSARASRKRLAEWRPAYIVSSP